MASHKALYISILSILLLDPLYAQTGQGCFLKTCLQPGQVRIDAIIDRSGNFAGGCNCGCNPALGNPQSSLYCAEPKVINYDPTTLLGDCSCLCPSQSTQSCIFPQVYKPEECGCGCPSFAPDPSTCSAPLVWRPELCQCACAQGSVGGPCIDNGIPIPDSLVLNDCTCNTRNVVCVGNQEADLTTGKCKCPERSSNGAFFPTCQPPLEKDPVTCDCVTTTTTLPPVGDIEVVCSDVGNCGCPYGTKGTCTITCDGTTDACKDGLIECNNPGYDCFLNCLSGSGCAGAAYILGPEQGNLQVSCLGENSCEGSVVFDASNGKDLIVVCDGPQACKGSVNFKFGNRRGAVACNGLPDSCSGGAEFTFLPNAQTTPGISFECSGQNCPANPTPFSNAPLPTIQNSNQQMVPGPSIPNNVIQPVYTTRNPNTNVAPINTAPNNNYQPGTGIGMGPGGGNTIISPNAPIAVVLPPEIIICEGVGVRCECSGSRACTIKCEAEQCKESTLICADGFDCNIICMDIGCQISSVRGPINGNFNIDCLGEGSCINSAFEAAESLDVSYTCSGKDACKGATHINCGLGNCNVQCPGESACDSAAINNGNAIGFQCYGIDAHCPPIYSAPPVPVPTPAPTDKCSHLGACPCNHIKCFAERDPNSCRCECPFAILLAESRGDPTICGVDATHQIYHSSSCSCDCPPNSQPVNGCLVGQQFNQNTCQCECPGGNECPGASIMNIQTCRCECPSHAPTASDCSAIGKVLRNCQCDCPILCEGSGQIQSPDTCACGCPYGTPTAAQCESGIVDHFACQCAPPLPSTFCCHTRDNFKPWRGRC
eukprot:253856_1